MSQFQFGNFENRWGVSFFQLSNSVVCNIAFIKNVPIWSEGGGQHFSKMSQIQKCPKGRKGGGSTLIGTLSQIFSIFYFDGSPKDIIEKSNTRQLWKIWNLSSLERGKHVFLSIIQDISNLSRLSWKIWLPLKYL